ncbi:YidH family protein [Timonella sp. A28]|uniref:YidH family protein n=1 Tax=Timonella sp. A28 TaxID=3442640 RepID=UPI003EB89E60
MALKRYPRSVYDVGDEPDPRFSLANERTFLSWIRTSLAFVAGGLALEALDVPVWPAARSVVTAAFLIIGLIVPLYAWMTWKHNERTLRQNKQMPGPRMAVIISVLTAIAVLALAIGLLIGVE